MRQKLFRFNDITNRANILEEGKELFKEIKGKWHEQYFKNKNEIILELGCGRGEYTIELARLQPEKNFIGIDVKGDRIWVGSTIALEEGLGNVAFLRTLIQNLDSFFAPAEVTEIWLTFPDPRPKGRDVRRRLTSPRFIALYQSILKPGGKVHLKTDDTGFFNYTLEVLKKLNITGVEFTYDLYDSDFLPLHQGIKTNYEDIFTQKGKKIKYLSFRTSIFQIDK